MWLSSPGVVEVDSRISSAWQSPSSTPTVLSPAPIASGAVIGWRSEYANCWGFDLRSGALMEIRKVKRTHNHLYSSGGVGTRGKDQAVVTAVIKYRIRKPLALFRQLPSSDCSLCSSAGQCTRCKSVSLNRTHKVSNMHVSRISDAATRCCVTHSCADKLYSGVERGGRVPDGRWYGV